MYDNEEEVKLFLIDGLRLLETVRGGAGVLQKSSEGFELVREIERGSLGHMQANEVKLKSIHARDHTFAECKSASAVVSLGCSTGVKDT